MRGVLDQFDHVCRQVDELTTARRLAQGGLRNSFEFKYHKDQGVALDASDPDEDDFRAFVTTLRPLVVSSDEPVFVNRIVNLAIRHVDDVELRDALIWSRDVWRAEQRGPTQLTTRNPEGDVERTYGAAEAFDLYVNGRVFHLDREREQALLALESGLPWGRPMLRFMLLDYAISATNYLSWVRAVLEEAKRRGALREEPIIKAPS